MKTRYAVAAVVGALAVVPLLTLAGSRPSCAADPRNAVTFQEDVLPIFEVRCVVCHSPGKEGYEKSGVDLTSYAGVMKGTKYGPMIVPGNPDTSNLMRLLDWKISPELRMPHNKKQLSYCDRDSIRQWIRQGAKDN